MNCALPILLAAVDPVEMLRNDRGFHDWLFYAIAALMLWNQLSAAMERRKAKAVTVTGGKLTVEQSERVATAHDVATLRSEVEELQQQTQAQFAAQARAGEQRVAAIATAMERETREISTSVHDLGGKLDRLVEALHEKVNGINLSVAALHRDVEHCTSADYRHETALAQLQRDVREATAARKPR